MLRRHIGLRVTIALIVVLAMGIAAPIHAAHHHGDPNSLHSACALCQLNSPACQPLLEPGAGISPEPLSTLAACITPAPRTASSAIAGTRAPPLTLA